MFTLHAMDPKLLLENIQSLTNDELILMLEQSQNYLPGAIEIAKQEFQRRSITEEQVVEARNYHLQQERKREEQKDKIRKSIQPGENRFREVLRTFDPLTTDIPRTERAIRIIVIVFGCIAVYGLLTNYKIGWIYFGEIGRSPFLSILALFDFVMPVLSIFFFYKRKKIGWILLVMLLTYSAVFEVLQIIAVSSLKEESLVFIRPPSLFSLITGFLFYSLTIWAICKKSLRDVFKVDKETALKSILFTAVLVSLMTYIMRIW